MENIATIPISFFLTIFRSLFWGVMFIGSRLVLQTLFGIDYIHSFWLFLLLIGVLFLAMLNLNRKLILKLESHFSIRKLLLPLSLVLLAFILYYSFPGAKDRAQLLFPNHFFVFYDWRYSFTKTLDICFQQFIFFMFLTDLFERYGQRRGLQLFILSMGIIHLPTLLGLGIFTGSLFVISSVLAGGIFNYLLFNPRFGICYSFSLHWAFYLVVGAIIRFCFLPSYP